MKTTPPNQEDDLGLGGARPCEEREKENRTEVRF
jgi:hypothetical protein